MCKNKEERNIGIALPEVFLADAVLGKVALIHVAAKVCLFFGLRSICLCNLIEGKFI